MSNTNNSGKHRRRFSNYLLNKSLQLRYIGFVTVVSVLLSTALGYMIYQQETKASSELLRSVAEFYCGNVPPDQCEELKSIQDVQGTLSETDSNLVLTMVGISVGLILVLVLYLLVMTHKVAGPLYKVSVYFNKMADGTLGETHPIRKGDMLQDFYENFRQMHVEVRERFQKDNDLLNRFLDACEQAGVEREGGLGTSLDRVQEHHQSRQKSLA